MNSNSNTSWEVKILNSKRPFHAKPWEVGRPKVLKVIKSSGIRPTPYATAHSIGGRHPGLGPRAAWCLQYSYKPT